jgi:hypothetical protein
MCAQSERADSGGEQWHHSIADRNRRYIDMRVLGNCLFQS